MPSFTWTTDKDEAQKEQVTLRSLVSFEREDNNRFTFEHGLAIGTAYDESERRAVVACVHFDVQGRHPGDVVIEEMQVDFPYIPGLLAFRVGPAICAALDKYAEDFDLLLFDGQGIAHPNGIGLASHIGVLYNKASVGVTRNNLFGNVMNPPKGERSYTEITHPRGKNVLGYALTLGSECAPVYTSPGHRLNPTEAVHTILQITRKGSCFPGALARAHSAANKAAHIHSGKL